ncbi:hypothetical protein Aperf_G00000002562 [Anoplocephala perfoliata]
MRFGPNAAWCAWAIENNYLPTEDDDEAERKKSDTQNGVYSKELGRGIYEGEYITSTSSISSIQHEEFNERSDSDLSVCTSETVPSFAKIRHSFSFDEMSHPRYCERYNPLPVASQRITITETNHAQKCSSSFNLSELYHIKTQAKKSLTTDFCQWAEEDGLGNKMIFSGLFFEGQPRHSQFEQLLDTSSDDSSLGFQELFKASPAEAYSCKKICERLNSDQETDSSIAETECETEKSVDEFDDRNMDTVYVSEDKDSESSTSSSSYTQVQMYGSEMHECRECVYYFRDAAECLNNYLGPHPTWLFRQTRWSIRFAPRQTAVLSMRTIRLPPWRGSNIRQLADLCWYCKKNNTVKNLVLLDPLALSPLSPLLNLMHHDTKPASRLTGILWMTPVEAISPFYHVPISRHLSVEEGEDNTYPRPFSLRLITLTAFVTNWVAWLSRIETYNSTGLTRFSPLFITDSVAVCYLQLLSLGCGQAPVADLWPLWLLRRLLTTSLNLSKLHFSLPFFHSGPSNNDFNFFFPFSDIDEI